MSELLPWLKGTLEAVEQRAYACPPWPWAPNGDNDEVMAADGLHVADGFALSNRQLRATVDHMAWWHPGRALALVAAVRAVIALYEELNEPHLYEAVVALAQPFEFEEGFRPEWKLPAPAPSMSDMSGSVSS